jgi:hypothetical protein
MGRTLILIVLLAALTVPAALAGDRATDGTLSVKRGKGAITLKIKGTVIGRVKNGRVQVRDFRPYDGNEAHFTGCKARHPSFGVSVCKGRVVGYRVDDGRFNVNVRGRAISITAVGRGSVIVDGAGLNDGVMSMDGAPYSSLPDDPTTFALGITVTGR